MQFRRSGQRDERRRRVLIEDRSDDSSGESSATKDAVGRPQDKQPTASAKRYTDAALPERQPHITDFVPVRTWTLSVLLMTACAIAVALIGLHGQLGAWSRYVGRAKLAALDLASPASLATWYSSLLLTLSAAASLIVFALERHRADDYRGRYRFWLWTTVALLVASIDATASLIPLAGAALAYATGVLAIDGGALWALMLAGLIWAPLAIRGAFEFRHCRGAAVALTVAVVGYALHVTVRFALLFDPASSLGVMAKASALLAGHVGLLFSLSLFARHVLLDAQGKLPARPIKTRRRKKKEKDDQKAPTKETSPRSENRRAETRIDEAHETTGTQRTDLDSAPEKHKSAAGSAKTKKSSQSTSHVEAVEDDFEDAAPPRKLSKAERRRLRKEQRRAKK